jgi:hypothetical protein
LQKNPLPLFCRCNGFYFSFKIAATPPISIDESDSPTALAISARVLNRWSGFIDNPVSLLAFALRLFGRVRMPVIGHLARLLGAEGVAYGA